MLMIICGAGASYDSISRIPVGQYDPYRPPLTVDLFEHIQANWRAEIINPLGSIRSLIQYFERLGSVQDFEIALEEWQAKSADREAVNRKLLSLRYYLQRLFKISGEMWLQRDKGGTNYLELLTYVNEWRHRNKEQVCVVTFNYDILLEHAFRNELNIRISNLDDYISRDEYKLIKPHGSINWGRSIESPPLSHIGPPWNVTAEAVISTGHLVLTPDYTMWDGQSLRTDGKPILPAIAIPLQSKAEFECPESHRAILEDCISKTTKVLVIGWRATEKHFLSLWTGKSSKIRNAIVINGTRDNGLGAVKALAGVGIARIDALDMGFSKLLAGRELQLFLDEQ